MEALGKSAQGGCTLHALGYLALAGALGIWAAGLTLRACGGEMIPPLDDTYIYLQYARGAAQGEPFSYQPGAEPTRGATSLLYPFLLAPAARVVGPEHLPWAAWGLGIVLLAFSALAADRWATRRVSPTAGWAAGLFTLLSGHYLWGAASGMDIALYGFALAGTVAAVPWYQDAPNARSGARRLGGLAAWLLFLGLARPEGTAPAMVIALAVALTHRAPNRRGARAALLLVPLAAVAITAATTILALGETTPNTLAAKAVWSEPRPDMRADLLRRLPSVFVQITRALLSDFHSRAFGFGSGRLLEALLLIGAGWGAVTSLVGRRRDLAGFTLTAVVFTGLLTALAPIDFNMHHHRYQIPYVPLAATLVAAGWWRVFPKRVSWRTRTLPLALIGVLLLPGTARYTRMVARNAANIHDQQVAMGRWIDANLPSDAVVGVNDAGAIAYYGNRRAVDLVGLVTNGSALPNRAGPGSLFEWLAALPARDRPTHLAIFPAWFPYLRHTSLVGPKLVQFTLGENTISGSDVKSLYETDWSHVDPDGGPVARAELVELWGFRVMDTLNVANLDSQREHGYEAWDTWRDTLREFPVAGRPDVTLIQGGRQPTRGERFTLRCRPREPAVLVMRTEAFRPFRLRVEVNGAEVGMWEIPAESLAWSEPMIEIPDSLLTGAHATFVLTQPDEAPPYPSFRYWLLQ
jgi:hypothetical protein